MVEAWIEIEDEEGRRREGLRAGLTRLGGPGCEVLVEGVGADQVHIWSDPPKAIYVGASPGPLLDGRPLDEAELLDGSSLLWGGKTIEFHFPPVVEELPPEPAAAAAPGRGSRPESGGSGRSTRPPGEVADRVTRRVLAGLIADLGLAEKKTVKRWQQAVIRGEFDADACAREVLDGANLSPEEPRLAERAGRLQRDLLMMPFQRGLKGATRRARGASRRGMAYVVANLIAISVYSLVLVAIMLLVRVNYDFSFDGTLDSFLELVTPDGGGNGD